MESEVHYQRVNPQHRIARELYFFIWYRTAAMLAPEEGAHQ